MTLEKVKRNGSKARRVDLLKPHQPVELMEGYLIWVHFVFDLDLNVRVILAIGVPYNFSFFFVNLMDIVLCFSFSAEDNSAISEREWNYCCHRSVLIKANVCH